MRNIAFGVYLTQEEAPFLTQEKTAKVVPREWILEEERLDSPKSKDERARKTGAITVMEPDFYVIRRHLSKRASVDMKFRVAYVPPGKDPPVCLWKVMKSLETPASSRFVR